MSAKARLTVVKIGGAVIDDTAAMEAFLGDFARLDGHKVLVHGGGRAASALCRRLGIEVRMVNGRRITDEASLEVAVMTYAGALNKRIAASLQARGCNAIGLCGADGDAVRAVRRPVKDIDYGLVGDVTAVNADLFAGLAELGLVPVVCAITHDGAGNLLNTNADTVAQAVAEGLAERYDVELVYCFELPGVLADVDDPASLIAEINPAEYERLKAGGIVSGGMLPKLDNAFRALDHRVSRVVIKSAENILNGAGTAIVP